MKLIKRFYSHYIKEILEIMRKPVVSVLPGHLSFFLLLSFIPLILIFGIIASKLPISIDNVKEFINIRFPVDVETVFSPQYSSSIIGIGLFILFISALYLASRATKAIILTANNIYDVKKSGFQDVVKSLIITVLIILLFIFISLILVMGEKIIDILKMVPDLGSFSKDLLYLINIFRWPISLFIIFFVIKVIYTLTPNKKIKSKTVNKGSLFTTLSWTIVTFIYSFYVTNYSSYDNYYGSASNIIILMLWIYLISQIFVIGMIINSIEDKKEEEKKKTMQK